MVPVGNPPNNAQTDTSTIKAVVQFNSKRTQQRLMKNLFEIRPGYLQVRKDPIDINPK